jgi:hypothetical protein
MNPDEKNNQDKINIIRSFQSDSYPSIDKAFSEAQQKSKKQVWNLGAVKVFDVCLKLILRIAVVVFFGYLLLMQNIWVFAVINDAMKQNSLKDLQVILSVLTSATLMETYGIARIIVQWLVKEIKYDD